MKKTIDEMEHTAKLKEDTITELKAQIGKLQQELNLCLNETTNEATVDENVDQNTTTSNETTNEPTVDENVDQDTTTPNEAVDADVDDDSFIETNKHSKNEAGEPASHDEMVAAAR